MNKAKLEALFTDRFDGAFFIALGVFMMLRVLALEETLGVTNSPNLVSYTIKTITMANGSLLPVNASSRFMELNPYAQFNLAYFGETAALFTLAFIMVAFFVKYKELRIILYSLFIALVFADFESDILNLASFYGWLNQANVLVLVWWSAAFIPFAVGSWQVYELLKKAGRIPSKTPLKNA